MVNKYEDLTLPPPEQFEDGYKPIPKPRTDIPRQTRRPPKPKRPPPSPIKEHEELSSKIKELSRVLKGHAVSYTIKLQDTLNQLNHFTKTKEVVESHLKDLLKTMQRFKFIETLEVTFEKKGIDSKTRERVSICITAFFNSRAKTITKADDTELELSMSRQEILDTIEGWLSEGSGWTTDRVESNYINVTTYI